MKTFQTFLIVIIFTIINISVYSQWSTNGTSIVYTYDNACIGCTDPGNTFEIRSSNIVTGIRLNYDDDYYNRWDIDNDNAHLLFKFGDDFSPQITRFTFYNSGDFKINTTGHGIIFPDGTKQTTAYNGSAGGSLWGLNVNGDDAYYNRGNVGIGVTSPSYKLQVSGDIYATNGWFRVSGNQGLYFQSHGGGFYMTDNSWIRTYGNKNFYHNSGIMRTDGDFQVGPDGDRFIVNASGNVGIGTAAPEYSLDVAGDIRSNWVRLKDQCGLYSQSYGLYLRPVSTLFWRSQSDNGIQICNRSGFVQGSLYHDNSQNFGLLDKEGHWAIRINTDNDEIAFTVDNNERIKIDDSGDLRVLNSGSGIIFPDGSKQTKAYTGGGTSVWDQSENNASYMGNVGIGTASPQANLHVKSTAGSSYIDIDKANSISEAGIQFRTANIVDFFMFTDNADNSALKIQANGLSGEGDNTPRIMIPKDNKNLYLALSGGSVGIGTTAPGYSLDVAGDIRSNWVRLNSQYGLYSQSYGLYLRPISTLFWQSRSDNGIQICNRSGSVKGSLYHDNSQNFGLQDKNGYWAIRINTDNDEIAFTVDNNERIKIDDSGDLRVLNSGSGIKFPDGTKQTTAYTGGGTSVWDRSGSNISYSSGNVGIGTPANTTSKLKVRSHNMSIGQEIVVTSDTEVYGLKVNTSHTSAWENGDVYGIYSEVASSRNFANTYAGYFFNKSDPEYESFGIIALSDYGTGIKSIGKNQGIYGYSAGGTGVFAESSTGIALKTKGSSQFNNGQVAMSKGTTVSYAPGYTLSVEGGIISDKVTVKLRSEWWPDYVFSLGYKLPTLIEIENFINQNGHLPGMPAASDVQEEGIDLGEMNAKLLQKLEEQTLYIIEMNKQLGELKNQLEELKTKK